MMRWYNPLTMEEEGVSVPMSAAQAIEILSGHRDSDRFIEELRRRRRSSSLTRSLSFSDGLLFLGGGELDLRMIEGRS